MKTIAELTDTVLLGDVLAQLAEIPDDSVDLVVTSPPYFGLRDYGVDGQIGLEVTPEAFIERLVVVFRECRRVLKPKGNLYVNIGDTYAGSGGPGDWNKRNTRDGEIKIARKDPPQKNLPMKKSKGRAGIPVPQSWGRRGNEPRMRTVAGYKKKDLIGIPWMLAFALRADGWWLREEIIWHKPNVTPGSAKDRCTTAHEQIFHLTKRRLYYYDHKAILEKASSLTHPRARASVMNAVQEHRATGGMKTHKVPGQRSTPKTQGAGHGVKANESLHTAMVLPVKMRNKRSVWTVPTQGYAGAHFATFPEDLVKPMILAGCPKDGIVLDPFLGSGTVAVVAREFGRHYIGIELSPEYYKLALKRISNAKTPMPGLI